MARKKKPVIRLEESPDHYNTIGTINTEMLLYQLESDMTTVNEPLKTIDVCFTCSDHSETMELKLNTTFNINLDDTDNDSVFSICSQKVLNGLSLNDRILELEDSIILIK